MTDIDILALFGIDIAELDAYERVDSGGGWAAFRVRKVKADRPAPGARLARAPRQGLRGQTLPPPSPGRDLRPLHRRPWVREAEQFPFRGLQRQGEDPEEGLLRPFQLRAPQEADIPHFRQNGPRK